MTKLPVPLEAEEAKTLVAYLRYRNYKFMHIPSETGSSPEAKRRAVRMKQQGTTKGFPDYVIIKDGKLIAIELKRVRGSVVSPEQREWLEALASTGAEAAICHGAAEAIEFIESLTAPSRRPTPSEVSQLLF